MNDVDFPVHRVLSGIDAALKAGFPQLKINVVVKRGVNENQILPLVRKFKSGPFVLRFIEFMDVGNTNGWRMDDVVTAAEIIRRIHAEFPIDSLPANYPGEVARRYRFRDGTGELGVIASVTQPFCQGCTRARLSAEGELFTCLFTSNGHDLRGLLRSEAGDDQIRTVIQSLWSDRSDRYSEMRTAEGATQPKVEMSRLGG